MIRKQAQFTQAMELRKRGFTYEEIGKIVGVAKSTISLWFSRETWSESIRENNKIRSAKENSKRIALLNTARKNQHAKLYAEAERSARVEYGHYKANTLFIAGLMIYHSCGALTQERNIRCSTTKAVSHRIFIRFAMEFLGVSREKVHFWLLAPRELESDLLPKEWSKKIGLPVAQFYKTQVIKVEHVKKPLHDGVGNTIIGSILLKKKLMIWIELALKDMQ